MIRRRFRLDHRAKTILLRLISLEKRYFQKVLLPSSSLPIIHSTTTWQTLLSQHNYKGLTSGLGRLEKLSNSQIATLWQSSYSRCTSTALSTSLQKLSAYTLRYRLKKTSQLSCSRSNPCSVSCKHFLTACQSPHSRTHDLAEEVFDPLLLCSRRKRVASLMEQSSS